MGGLCFINSTNTDLVVKASIKIKECVSGSIALGIGSSKDYL